MNRFYRLIEYIHINILMAPQDSVNSKALAMELPQYCTKATDVDIPISHLTEKH